MRFPYLVFAAACAAAPSAAVFAGATAVVAAPDQGFRRQAALPTWALPLGEMPATTRIDPVVIRLNETQAWVGAVPATLINRAIQVNDSSELGTIGQIGIDYFAAYQKLLLHRVVILRDGRLIDHTATVNARPLQRETAMESGMVGGATTLQLLLEDVRSGDTLWITYTIEGDNPVFGKTWSDSFGWDSGTPVELRLLTVLHPVARPLQWRQLGDFRTDKIAHKAERVGGIERLRFEGRAIEAIDGEPSIPSDYLPGRMLQFSEYRDWQEVANWADGLFPKNKPSPALTALAQQFAREPDAATRAAAALRWVQHEVRYFSVSIGENSHRPQVPDVVLKRRYGDCKDKSYLLISLLSEMGIEARPVLLSASAPTIPARVLASPMWFNHVVVQIKIDGHDYYVDPTSARQPEPLALIPGASPGAAALLVERASTALVTLPPRTDTLPHHELVQNIAVADLEGAATMEARDIFRGSYADYARQRYPTMSVTEQKKAMLANYEKRYPGITLQGAPVLQDFPAENRYEIRSRYRMPKAITLKDKVYAIEYDPQLIDNTLGIPAKIVRNFPLELAAGKFRGRYRLNITWPAQVRGEERPQTNTVDNAFFRAHEEYTFRGNVVNYLMDYRIKSATVAAADMPGFQVEAKRLDAYSVGSFKVAGEYVSAPELMRYSPRELDSLRNGRALVVETPILAAKKDADIDSEVACRFLTLTAGIEDVVGGEVLRQARRLEKAVTANRAQASARECLALLAFSRGQFDSGAALYRAEAATLKDDSRAVRNLAWASLYAGDAEAAVTAMARYRTARAASATGVASNTDIADQIALLQRAGKPLPAEAERIASEIPDGPWPRPLLAMQAGLITPAALVTAAEALEGDARAFALTEAWFYIGQSHLARKDTEAARLAFQWIASGGIRSSDLYPQALAELQRLAPSDTQFKAGVSAYKGKDAGAARAQWEQGAASGDANAIFALGYLAFEGDGVPKDVSKARALFEKAAALGHARAHFRLGSIYELGIGIAAEPTRSFEHYLAAAELGDGDAQAAVGFCYRNGYGVAKDAGKSVFWYSRALQRGSLVAADELGRASQFGWGVPIDLEAARRMYLLAAEGGNAAAQMHLGWMLSNGAGGAIDQYKAVAWYRKSAAQGNLDAQNNLGDCLMKGAGVGQDYAEALRWFRKAAEQGSSEAMANLGFAYHNGRGVVQDYAEAHQWYLKAAKYDNSTAEYNLGLHHRYGQSVKKDLTESLKWFLKAASHGDIDAEAIVGDAYRWGKGVARDPAEALKWYNRASEHGDAGAQVVLGQMLTDGLLPKDEKRAFKLFEQAAAQGNAAGQYMVGIYHETGLGVAASLDKAVDAYRKAAALGSASARNRLFVMHELGRLAGPDLSDNVVRLSTAEMLFHAEPWVSLGGIYAELGKPAKAQATYERALSIKERGLLDESGMIEILNKLGAVLVQQSKFSEAEKHYKRIVALQEKTKGADHPELADALYQVANVIESQGRYAEAEPLRLRLLAIRENVFGAKHPGIVSALMGLASLYESLDRSADAHALHLKVLAIREEANGRDHLANINAMSGVARDYAAQGDDGKAEALYQRVLAIQESALGAEHVDIVPSLSQLAALHQKRQRHAQALPLFVRALALTEKADPQSHAMATALNNLGLLYSDMEKFEQADALFARSMAMRQALLGPDHADVGLSLQNYGILYSRQHKYAQAEASFTRALAIMEATFGKQHTEVAEVLNECGFMLSQKGDYAQAEALYARALAIREQASGPLAPAVRDTLRKMADLYRKTNRASLAQAFEQRAAGTSGTAM
jgi:TPR repeat protein